jgi:hypothetical protein
MTIREKIEAVFCLKGEDAEALEELIREIVRDEIGLIEQEVPF